MGYKIWDRVYGIKGGQDNFSFSRSKFLRHSKNCRVIPNIFEMFSWAPTDVFTAAAVSAEVVIMLKTRLITMRSKPDYVDFVLFSCC